MLKRKISVIALIIASAIAITSTQSNTVEPFIERTTGNTSKEKISREDGFTPYSFDNHRFFGAGDLNGSMDFEGGFGVELETNNDIVTYSYYNRFSVEVSCSKAELILLEAKWNGEYTEMNKTHVTDLETGVINKKHRFSVSKLNNGTYRIHTEYSYATKPDIIPSVDGHIYVENGKAWVCRVSEYNKAWTDKLNNDIKAFTANIKDECLETKNLSYPTLRPENYHCVKEIMDISDDILKKYPNASDEFKVYLFTKYLADNYAYDYYRLNNLHGQSRAKLTNGYIKPENFMINNGVGVCWDYVNWLTIMCRHHGIPCTSLSNGAATHTWNIVYMHNEWVAIDLTKLNVWACLSEDTDKNKWISENHFNNWSYKYGFFVDPNCYLHEDIWVYNMPEPERYKELGKSIY